MKTLGFNILVMCGGLVLAGAAHAGSIAIDSAGGPVVLHSGNLSSILRGSSPDFTTIEMASIHQDLHSDGINTDGSITFLLANTGDDLTFLALVDDPMMGLAGPESTMLGMSSTAPSTTDFWINDSWQDLQNVQNPTPSQTNVSGTFFWRDGRGGDAFAWSELAEGDGVTFNFNRIEGEAITGSNAFQFVTWNGESWELVDTARWSGQGQFAFSFTVVPLPAPLALGLAVLAGVVCMRRRRLA